MFVAAYDQSSYEYLEQRTTIDSILEWVNAVEEEDLGADDYDYDAQMEELGLNELE